MAASSSAATATLASSVSTTASVATPPAPRLASAGGAGDAGGAGEEGGGNPVTALVGFVKDQLVRMKRSAGQEQRRQQHQTEPEQQWLESRHQLKNNGHPV